MMQDNAISRQAKDPVGDRSTKERRFVPTQIDLLHLGMFRVGYVKSASDGTGDVEVVVHGADGRPVAEADSIEFAVDAASELGLVLVAVH